MRAEDILEMNATPWSDGDDQEAFDYDSVTEGMARYDESAGDNQQWCTLTEIIVPTEQDKVQLLKAFNYIHNLREIDSDFLAVNTLMHMYQCPDKIKVQPQ